MALNLVSPGVNVREIDQTVGRIDPANNQVAGFCGPFQMGPIDQPVLVDSERSLLNIFGKPVDKDSQNEYWLTASNYLSYGGVLRLIRLDDTALKTANVGTSATSVSLKITNFDNFQNSAINDTNWVYAAKTPGTWANGLTVCTIDNFADQIITGIGTTGVSIDTFSDIATKTGNVGVSTAVITGINTNLLLVGHVVTNANVFGDSNPAILSIGAGTVTVNAISINNTSLTGESFIFESKTTTFTPLDIQVGQGISQDVAVTIPSQTGTSSAFAGVIRGIITGIGKGELYVKIFDRVSSVTGVIEPIKYQKTSSQANGYSFTSGQFDIFTSAGVSKATNITSTSVSDWYDSQTLKIKNSTVYWRSIAEKPGTTEYALSRNSENDEIHVVVVDDDGKISGTAGRILEKHLFLSKARDNRSAAQLKYYVDYLANNSAYVYGGSAPLNTVSGYAVGASATTFTSYGSSWKLDTQSNYFKVVGSQGYSLNGGHDYGNSNGYAVDVTTVISGYENFRNPSEYQLDYIISGPSASSLFESQSKASAIISIAEQRKDCIATISPHKASLTGTTNTQTQTDNIIEFFSFLPSSSYAVFDSGYKYTYDRFNNKFLYLACNSDIAGILARTSTVNYPWYSPGGTSRGTLNNVVKLLYNPSQSQRDSLYINRINPILASSGQGIYLFGDKTALAYASAFDRINVRRLFLTIERQIERASKSLLFEFNDEITRNNFVNLVEPYLRDIKSKRGISDFIVVCDETNNTPDVIDSNQFLADIYVKPARSINYIGLTFVATRTGVSFSEIIGNV